MIKRILVPTDGSDASEKGLHYAIALAKAHNASLVGLHVVDVKLLEGPFLRDISASLGTAPYINYQGNITMILEERGKAALESFKQACESAGVTCTTTQATGIVSRVIVENGELADLIVLGRGGEHNDWLEGLVGSTTEAVVRRASQPVLVTGSDALIDGPFLVAYDGTQHARQALKIAASLSASWGGSIHLLVVGEEDAKELIDEAREYFQAHDVNAEYSLTDGDPGEVIVSEAEKVGAGLIIMGSYGHSKVRQLVVGSTTTYVINHTSCPVLLTR